MNGGRSRKDGCSRYFVGYKKRTLRLWLRQHNARILLAPLISWAAPANRDDAVFLEPSVRYCAGHLKWTPDIVVGDLGYLQSLHLNSRPPYRGKLKRRNFLDSLKI